MAACPGAADASALEGAAHCSAPTSSADVGNSRRRGAMPSASSSAPSSTCDAADALPPPLLRRRRRRRRRVRRHSAGRGRLPRRTFRSGRGQSDADARRRHLLRRRRRQPVLPGGRNRRPLGEIRIDRLRHCCRGGGVAGVPTGVTAATSGSSAPLPPLTALSCRQHSRLHGRAAPQPHPHQKAEPTRTRRSPRVSIHSKTKKNMS